MVEKLDFSGSSTSGLDFSNTDQGSTLDWFKGFGKSALESIPELIGIDPSEGTKQFRQDYPVSGFVSELAGTAVPYMGWFKAAKSISAIEKAAKALGSSKNAFLAGAGRSAAVLAPFELGRVAANEVVGDQNLSQMLGATATDLALGSGIGGVLHGIASAGTRDPKLPSIFPGIDLAQPLPLMARQMREILDSGKITDPDMISRAQGKLKETLSLARSEELTPSQKYVGDIEKIPGRDVSELERSLNRWFRGSSNPDASVIRTRKFAVGQNKDFGSQPLWDAEAKEADLPDGFEEHGQYFRNVTFNRYNTKVGLDTGEKKAKRISETFNNIITKNMESVGDGNFMAREADDGLFVIARKYQGIPKKGATSDRWVLFKTDKPGYFLPDQDKYAGLQFKIASWQPQAQLAPDGGPVYNSLRGYVEQYPFADWTLLQKSGKLKEVVSNLLPKNVQGPPNELIARLGEAVGEYLSPRIAQFRKAPRANWIVNGAKIASDSAETVTNQLLYGNIRVDPGKSQFFGGLQKIPTGLDGLTPAKQLFDLAGDKGVKEFVEKIWRNRVSVAQIDGMMLRGDISPEAAKLAKGLEAIRDWRTTSTNAVELATGRPPTEFDATLYGLPRSWEGDTIIPITNDSGQVVAHAGGANRKLAQKNAQRLVEQNPGWRALPEVSQSQDPAGVASFLGGRDESLWGKQDLRGFKWDLDLPSKDELFKDYEEAVRRNMKYQSNMTVGDIMQSSMAALNREDPAIYRQAEARLRDYAGVMSDFGKWQNSITDKVLAPVVGNHSASKIVGITNTAMMHFTLGAMKLAYPAINALQFVQTVIPEAAFVLGKAPEERLAPNYSFFAAGGEKGPIGGLGVLNPIKMMGRALMDMRKPSGELSGFYERAIAERVLEPRVVEEYVGASATKISQLRAVLKGEESFTGWLRALSEFLPAETERLSRTHAFTVGYNIARDFLKSKGEALNAEQMYNFAKQFTENTMYLYSTADRPRVFTTPAGSALGLFKNWMFHYISQMGQYTDEAFTKGNFAPLLWQTAGTLGLGGLAATPLIGVADKFSKQWSDKSLLQQAYDHFGESADWLMYGLPGGMGVSLSSSVDVPALSNPVKDGSSLFSIAAWGRLKSLGQASKAAFDYWQTTGEHPGYDRKVREELIKTFAPTTVYRSISAFARPDAITSIGTGYPIVKDPSISNRLLYAAGFNPTELQKAYDVSQELYENKETLKAQEQKLGLAWANAEMNGDSAQMATIMRQGMTWGVDVSRVIKNGMYEINKQRKDIIERGIKPRDIGAWKSVMARGEE